MLKWRLIDWLNISLRREWMYAKLTSAYYMIFFRADMMRVLIVFFIVSLTTQSCTTRWRQNKKLKAILKNCDEVDIIYLNTENSFVFKTTDSFSINDFVELLTVKKENLPDTCKVTERLVYKNNGKEIFSAQISDIDEGCGFVLYTFNTVRYKHLLTYRTGMGINEIYWHKKNPQKNPWPVDFDTAKFHYVDLKDYR
ncbi:MAG: hypothetical protein QM764_03270 [Chitinophagaceae bacterium]